jgi:hypothetical protein
MPWKKGKKIKIANISNAGIYKIFRALGESAIFAIFE